MAPIRTTSPSTRSSWRPAARSTAPGNWIYRHGALLANGVYSGGSSIGIPSSAIPQLQGQYQLVGVNQGEPWRLLTSAFLHYGPSTWR